MICVLCFFLLFLCWKATLLADVSPHQNARTYTLSMTPPLYCNEIIYLNVFGIIIYIIIHIKKKLHTSQLAVYLYSQRDEKMIVSCDSSLVVVFTFLTATAIKSPPTFDGAYICSYFSQLTMCVCCVHYILYTNPFFVNSVVHPINSEICHYQTLNLIKYTMLTLKAKIYLFCFYFLFIGLSVYFRFFMIL